MERTDSSSLHIESLNLEPPPVQAALANKIRNNTNGVSIVNNRNNNKRHHHLHHNRRRSLSVATGQPSVETVIVKAKRAASSLWMLLHAQNCNLAAGSCQHPGCQEAKLMHLHLKCCPAMATADSICPSTCPTSYRGCNQARKLLAHYRRCRNIRARQVGCRANDAHQQQHSCLVCSLVARQARSALELKVTRVSPNSSLSPCKRKHFGGGSSSGGGNSFMVGEGLADEELDFGKRSPPTQPPTTPPPPVLTTTTSSAKKKMPPPPPRGLVIAAPAHHNQQEQHAATSSSSAAAASVGPLLRDFVVETVTAILQDDDDHDHDDDHGDDDDEGGGHNRSNSNKQGTPPPTRDRSQSFSQMELDASTTLANLVRPRSSSEGGKPPPSSLLAHVKNGSSSTCETIAEEASLGSKESI